MRQFSLLACLLGIALMGAAYALAAGDHADRLDVLERGLADRAQAHTGDLDAYFDRARSAILLTANQPGFRAFDEQPGTRVQKVRSGGRNIADATSTMAYLERLYPDSIGEVCFIDNTGSEAARVVRGDVARTGDLSTQEWKTPFFAPSFRLRRGDVYLAKPYVSPDTNEWVVANTTVTPSADGRKRSIVHFEVTVESFRRALGATAGAYDLRVVDARTGRVVIDGGRPQRIGAPLGAPTDRRFAALVRGTDSAKTGEVDGHPVALRRIRPVPGNANEWVVVASATAATPSLLGDVGALAIAVLLLGLVLTAGGLVAVRAQRRSLEAAAHTDSLTGLGNRRQLLADLEAALARAADSPKLLMLFDLDGFKSYNDTFGHLAGDALLHRLGQALAKDVAPHGAAYRLGGDEFCVLASAHEAETIRHAAPSALAERGEGFEVTASHGAVLLPTEASEASEALRLADERMYAQKHVGRPTAVSQSKDVLLRVLAERHPDVDAHSSSVARLAEAVARHLGLADHEAERVRVAAELHDIGKVGIPDTILHKRGPLNEDEWAFMRRHTIIGERILTAAPSLEPVARIVRASHERLDGRGYPDGLAGEDIPLAARIVFVCDSFDAMTSDRPYAKGRSAEVAIAELRRCAGAQYDPAVVEAFAAVHAECPRFSTRDRGRERVTAG
jgi:diguanylate cyclase (GGDEF)-like protein/putative nucleotidyltransferase with HDIG domain